MLSIDDYYMTEVTEEIRDERGIKRKTAVMKYQHDPDMDEVNSRQFVSILMKRFAGYNIFHDGSAGSVASFVHLRG